MLFINSPKYTPGYPPSKLTFYNDAAYDEQYAYPRSAVAVASVDVCVVVAAADVAVSDDEFAVDRESTHPTG